MKHVLLSAVVALVCTSASAQLNGTYTINAAGTATATNYLSVSSAISDLSAGTRADGGPVNGPAVSGPVTLRIVAGSGPYNEQVIIPAILGATAVNTIRLTGNTTRETITFGATTTTDRSVVKLNNADYVTLDSLTLVNTSATYGVGVHLTTTADYNTVSNCIITVDSTSTSANMCGIAISGTTATTTGDNGDYNTITNNMVYGGYYGISINGTSTTVFDINNTISNNTFKGFYYYGMRIYEQTNPTVTGNTIHARMTGTTAGYGAYCYYNTQLNFSGNKLLRHGNYGIYTAYQNTLAPLRSTIANNMISGSLNLTSPYGIYATTSSTNVDIVYNSISLTSGNGRCIYILSGSGNTVQNNALSVTGSGTGYALYISATTYVTTVNYNDFWAPGSSNFIYIGAAYTTATYIGGGGYNANSINFDPVYTNPANNLHVFTNALSNVATNIVGITTDIDGDARPSNGGYDIGADEYTPLTDDVSLVSILSPTTGNCASTAASVDVVILNYGSNAITSVPLTADYTGFTSGTLSITWTGNLAFGQRDTVTIGTINTMAAGTLNIEAYAAMLGDQNSDNDTLNTSATIYALGTPATGNDDTVCTGSPATLSVTVDGMGHAWYDSLTGGTLLGTGDVYTTAPITATTTFYVQSSNQVPSNITTTFANNNSCGGGNMFDITAGSAAAIIIDSFACNLSAGTSTVSLYYKTGTHIGFELTPAAWTLAGSVTVTSTGTGGPTYVALGGLTIPAGQTYGIFLAGPSFVYTTLATATTYSNADISVICGTGLCGLFSGTNFPRGWNGTVYYKTSGCPGTTRTPITVTAMAPPVVALGPDTASCSSVMFDAGNPGETFMWSSGDTTQTITASTGGTYWVGVTTQFCSAVYDTVNFTLNAPPTLSVASASGTVCAGESDTLSVSGALTYSWSSGGTSSTEIVAPVSSTMYYVTGTDANGCSNMDSILVNVNALPSVTLALPQSDFCIGSGSVTLSGETPAGGTFSGTAVTGNSFDVDAAGTGTHTVMYMYTDGNGCTNADSNVVTVNALPTVTLNLPLDTFCLGSGSVTLSGESPVGGTFSGTAVTGNTFNVDTAGTGMHTITYMYTDTNGCASMDSQMVMVDPCLYVAPLTALHSPFSVYPNPNNGAFTISLAEGISEMKFVLYNSLGETVMQFTLNSNNASLTNENLPSGIYLLNGTGGEGAVTKTIIVK